MSKLIGFAFLILASFAGHAEAKPKSYFSVSYADWDVVCDNVNHCEAITLGDTQGLRLSIVRDAGPDGRIHLNLTGGFTYKALDHFYLDEQRTVFQDTHWRAESLTGEISLLEFSNENEADIALFLRTISKHTTLRIQENATSKQHSISLIGLNESLLAIDERQGRKNNETAFIPIAGDQTTRTKVPTAPLVPNINAIKYKNRLSEEETNQLITMTRKNSHDKKCSHSKEIYSDDAYALSDEKALILLECEGAVYNTSYRVFLANRQQKPVRMKPLTLPVLSDKPDIQFLMNADYDPDNGILKQFRKYRGLSDCGNKASWAFDGVKFNLLEYREYTLCKNGITFEFPRFWHSNITHENTENPN